MTVRSLDRPTAPDRPRKVHQADTPTPPRRTGARAAAAPAQADPEGPNPATRDPRYARRPEGRRAEATRRSAPPRVATAMPLVRAVPQRSTSLPADRRRTKRRTIALGRWVKDGTTRWASRGRRSGRGAPKVNGRLQAHWPPRRLRVQLAPILPRETDRAEPTANERPRWQATEAVLSPNAPIRTGCTLLQRTAPGLLGRS